MDTEYCQDDCDISLSTEEASWVAAIAYLGCVCVGPFAGHQVHQMEDADK